METPESVELGYDGTRKSAINSRIRLIFDRKRITPIG